MVAMGTMQNPESSLSFWCSMIPLTSPIVMMARIPFGVPYWQIAVSMVIMLVTFVRICMDGCKSLQDRYPYVWKENILERDVEMAEI